MTGFFDLQVNGYSGVDFNTDGLTDADFAAACASLRRDGVQSILATVITAPGEQMVHRIDRIAAAIEADPDVRRMIRGIHVEGPFISDRPGYAGAHPVESIRPADLDRATRLLDAGRGHVCLVTLAPERDPGGRVIRRLHDAGIRVAAGHSDASLDELHAAMDAGLTLFTHLGNACPNQMPRHDNIIQRVLSLSDRLSVSLIADGHHLPWFVLGNFFRLIPQNRVIIVSDAISATGLGAGTFSLGDQSVTVDADGAAWAADRTHFAGAATPVVRMREQLQRHCGITVEMLDTWTIINPQRLIEGVPD